MAVSYALGRLPNDPRKPRVRLRRLAGATLTPPSSADWQSSVPSWPVLANDRIGDCTAAGAGHIAQMVNWYGQGVDSPVTDQDAIAMYSAISGYDPRSGRNDIGATLQDALSYWRKTGIGGNKITAFAQLDAQDLDLVRNCIAIFGAVYTGLNFPSSAMDQFNRGQVWDVVKRSPIEGGHCVPIGAHDANTFECVTWGRRQKMTVDFYRRYFDECWVAIDLDWLRAAGTSPAGLDVATLNADFEALTGEPAPFPQDNPGPVDPGPVDPIPPVDDEAPFYVWLRQAIAAIDEFLKRHGY